MYIRHNTSDIDIYTDVYKNNEYNLLESFNKDDLLIDIGAHIGYFSLLAYDKYNIKNIICYEPDLDNFNSLKENLKNIANIELHNKAIWRSDGQHVSLDLSKYDVNNGRPNTASCSVILNSNKHTVPCIGLDSVLDTLNKNYNKIIIKLDCEGSEYPILFTSKLLNKINSIYIECHDLDNISLEKSFLVDNITNYNFNSIKLFLESHGFNLITYKKLHIHLNMQLHLCKFTRSKDSF